MKSYKEIAEETGTSVEDVRMAMLFATKHETPHTVEYNAFSDPSSDDIGDCPARYGRIGIEFETWWGVCDYDRQGHYVGCTREEAVINALNGGFRA